MHSGRGIVHLYYGYTEIHSQAIENGEPKTRHHRQDVPRGNAGSAVPPRTIVGFTLWPLGWRKSWSQWSGLCLGHDSVSYAPPKATPTPYQHDSATPTIYQHDWVRVGTYQRHCHAKNHTTNQPDTRCIVATTLICQPDLRLGRKIFWSEVEAQDWS